jgi:hypothetical protein
MVSAGLCFPCCEIIPIYLINKGLFTIGLLAGLQAVVERVRSGLTPAGLESIKMEVRFPSSCSPSIA